MKKPLREYLADLTEYVNVYRILRIGRRATKKAQEDNRRMGIPNVYSINGQLYYELPNGELTTEEPMLGLQPEEIDTPKVAGQETATDAAPIEAAARAEGPVTEESLIETHDKGDEDMLDTPAAGRAGKNGTVVRPRTRAHAADPAADLDR